MRNYFKIAAIAITLLNASQLFAQSLFSGKITGNAAAKVFISYPDTQKNWVNDSCILKNEAFSFKLNITQPTRVDFSVKNASKKSTVSIYLEPGTITADGTYDQLKKLKITGSKTQDENLDLQASLDKVEKDFAPTLTNLDRLNKEIKQAKAANRGERIIDSLQTELVVYENQRLPFVEKYEAAVRQFVTTHPNSYISPVQMSVYAVSWPIDLVKKIYYSFSPYVQNSPAGLGIKKIIGDREVKAAMKAKTFTKPDLNGKTINLADFKGRYVLLDFWGSWCLPCRQSTPHIKELFAKYQKLGLSVIAIACQDNAYDWKKAIKKDGTAMWVNIMDEPKSNLPNKTRISDDYKVSVFPTKILIDKTGIIIGRYDSANAAAELDKKLVELFN